MNPSTSFIIHKAQTCGIFYLHTQNALLCKHKIFECISYIHHKGLLLCAQWMLANFEPLSFSIQWDQTTFFGNTFSNRGCARIMVI